MRYQRAEPALKLDGLAAAQAFFAGCIADGDASLESLWVAHVDDDARCLHLSRYQGDACGTDFPVREIVLDAGAHGSTGLILAHNHPSGDPRPSEADCRATRKLSTAAEALDCTLLDHLIFAGDACTSLRRSGLL
jgi:DNA repair protein RadC